jgi:YfiH family protein
MRRASTAGDEAFALTRRVGRAAFAFTTRLGGVSQAPYASLDLGLHVGDDPESVGENRRRVLKALGVFSRPLVEAQQVHGGRVAIIDEDSLTDEPGPRHVVAGADALVTRHPGVVLSLYFADCVPIFLSDREGTLIGLAHAGWRGTVAHIAAATAEVMAYLAGTQPAALSALIGPCIGRCCYEVGEEVAAAVVASAGGTAGRDLVRKGSSPGKRFLDLAAANAAQLVNVGIPREAISLSGPCTCCERAAFFSVRGDGRTTGRCGAFAYLSAR